MPMIFFTFARGSCLKAVSVSQQGIGHSQVSDFELGSVCRILKPRGSAVTTSSDLLQTSNLERSQPLPHFSCLLTSREVVPDATATITRLQS